MEKFGIIIFSFILAILFRMIIGFVVPDIFSVFGPFAIFVLWTPLIGAVYICVKLWKSSNEKNVIRQQIINNEILNKSDKKIEIVKPSKNSPEKQKLLNEAKKLENELKEKEEIKKLKRHVDSLRKKIGGNKNNDETIEDEIQNYINDLYDKFEAVPFIKKDIYQNEIRIMREILMKLKYPKNYTEYNKLSSWFYNHQKLDT